VICDRSLEMNREGKWMLEDVLPSSLLLFLTEWECGGSQSNRVTEVATFVGCIFIIDCAVFSLILIELFLIYSRTNAC